MVEHVVVLAGGSGTRLWPASQQKRPKQFLDLGQGGSLLLMTLRRARSLNFSGYLCIVTHRDHLEETIKIRRLLEEEDKNLSGRIVILPEHLGRNTAPAIIYAGFALKVLGHEQDTFLVLPADHNIEPISEFTSDVERAAALAEREWLVTFGIKPTRPETGYGYLEAGAALGEGYLLKRFNEKPDLKSARSFLRAGNHYWNSGMFVYRLDFFLSELYRYTPEVVRPFEMLTVSSSDLEHLFDMKTLAKVYGELPSISIDYALMEKSDRCVMVPAAFRWSDVGSWDEVSELYRGSEDLFTINAEGNFVYSDIPVALAGVSDLIVVVKNGILLIVRKGDSQGVRDLVQKIRSSHREDLL